MHITIHSSTCSQDGKANIQANKFNCHLQKFTARSKNILVISLPLYRVSVLNTSDVLRSI